MSTTMNLLQAQRIAEQARAACYGASPEASVQRHQEALQLIEGEETLPFHADVLRWQGTVLRDRGRTSEAEPLYRKSLEVASQIGYEGGVAHALNCLAGLAQRRGDLMTAADLLTDAHVLAAKCGDSSLATMIQTNLGIIADIRGNSTSAVGHFRIALRIAELMGDEQQIIRVLINLGSVLIKMGRFDEADVASTRGLAIARQRGELYYEGVFEENRAELRLMRNEVEDAFPSIRRAYDIADQRRDDVRKASALKLRGAYERLVGRPHDAAESLQHGLTLAAVGEDALLGGEILYQFGLALEERGDGALATEVWRTAVETFERIAARDWTKRTRERLSFGTTGRYL